MFIRFIWATMFVSLVTVPSLAAAGVNINARGALDPVPVTKALQVLYGKDAHIRINERAGYAAAIWQAAPASYAELFPHLVTSTQVISVVRLAAPFDVHGNQEYLVLTASNPHSPKPLNDCHECKAALGGVLLKKQGGDWTVDKQTWHIADLGVYAEVPNGRLIPIGAGSYAALFPINDTEMGDTTQRMVIVGIVGDGLQELVDFPAGGDDTYGTCLAEEGNAQDQGVPFNRKLWCYSYTSDYEFVKADDSDHFDLTVRYMGTDADSPANVLAGLKITNVSRVDTYKWNGKGYKLLSSVKAPAQ